MACSIAQGRRKKCYRCRQSATIITVRLRVLQTLLIVSHLNSMTFSGRSTTGIIFKYIHGLETAAVKSKQSQDECLEWQPGIDHFPRRVASGGHSENVSQ